MERQLGTTLEEIRIDHVNRYRFAAKRFTRRYIVDAACGCGYGSKILFDAGNTVIGVDKDAGAIEHARRYFAGPTYLCADVNDINPPSEERNCCLVSLETIEHLNDHSYLRHPGYEELIASVPNEEHYPFKAEKFAGETYPHLRHYTPGEFDDFLNDCGWAVEGRYCQQNKWSDVEPGWEGAFLVYVCRRR